MRKPVKLTKRARNDYADILLWTRDTFGQLQAERYANQLETRIAALRDGIAHVRTGQQITGNPAHAALCLVAAGEHVVIYTETPQDIRVLALLHSRSDLTRHISDPSLNRKDA